MEISVGKSSLTEDYIRSVYEDDQSLGELLLGLYHLHEDLNYRKQQEENIKSDLRQAVKDANAAANARTSFLANMSHEIRTPMNGVLGNADLLLDESLTSHQMNLVKTIISSGQTMLHLLNDILDFSKIESEQFSLDFHSFDFQELCESLKSLFQVQASEKDLDLILEIDKQLKRKVFKSDSYRLRQVLSNLINNSLKFTHKGHVKLSTKLEKINDQIYHISFEVADTGIGIKKENIKHLFKDFSQADSSTTREFGGTGLGLAISQKLVHLLGGSIEVVSTEKLGSQFFFTIPLELCESNIQEKEKTQNDDHDVQIKQLKVLLVEDNLVNLELAINFLKKLNIDCETAINGQIAVNHVKNGDFDIVLMDCQMPILDGYQASKEIRLLNEIKQPKIIAMTANAMADDREKCLQAGMDDYLSKPVSKKKIQSMLTKWYKILYPTD